MAQPYDVIVIGEGVSGLTAAGALAAAGLRTATLEAQLFGGLVINVNELEPAIEGKPASGAELAAEMMQANADAGVTSIQEPVTLIRQSGAQCEVVTASGSYHSRHVIVASGARLKKLGIPGETDYEGRGVSQCADCDGPMYQNEDVVVVGGGDSALQEALVLARYCRRVHIVHRQAKFKGAAHFADQVATHDKISVIWTATLDAILGSQMVEKARLKHADGHVQELACAGVFAYIGLEPNVNFLPSDVRRDDAGYVRTNASFETSVPSISAIGAVRSGYAGTLSDAMREAQRASDAVRARLA
ncbi:MAG TPA: FAD-dependent oxidoreductase [Burkholderiales bacterium]